MDRRGKGRGVLLSDFMSQAIGLLELEKKEPCDSRATSMEQYTEVSSYTTERGGHSNAWADGDYEDAEEDYGGYILDDGFQSEDDSEAYYTPTPTAKPVSSSVQHTGWVPRPGKNPKPHSQCFAATARNDELLSDDDFETGYLKPVSSNSASSSKQTHHTKDIGLSMDMNDSNLEQLVADSWRSVGPVEDWDGGSASEANPPNMASTMNLHSVNGDPNSGRLPANSMKSTGCGEEWDHGIDGTNKHRTNVQNNTTSSHYKTSQNIAKPRQSDLPEQSEKTNGDLMSSEEKEAYSKWVRELEVLWSKKSGAKGPSRIPSREIQGKFSCASNPATACLFLVEHCNDYKNGKQGTLAYAILKEFEKWINPTRVDINKFLDKSTKIYAFYVATRYNTVNLELIVKLFKLKHPNNEYLMPYVRSIITQKKFKEATQCAIFLGLQEHLSMKELVLPLLLIDQVNMVQNYVKGSKEQQVKLVMLLDNLLDKNFDLYEATIEAGVSQNEVKRDKVTPKQLQKLATRLLKLYQVPPELCPNISFIQSSKAMRFLMYKKYVEGSLTSTSWDEILHSIIENDQALQIVAIDLMIDHYDIEGATRFANFYNLPEDQLPSQVVAELQTTSVTPSTNSHKSFDQKASPVYLKLSIPSSSIHVVDTQDMFYRSLQQLGAPGNVIGIDGEWKPAIGQLKRARISLLQCALSDQVFLFDIITLKTILQKEEWLRLATAVFCNETNLKIGYGIEGDMQMLQESVPNIGRSLKRATRVLDLHFVCDQIRQSEPALLGVTSSKEESGLSALVHYCLDLPLDKTEQMSNWEKRPLRDTQIEYAALDALCLIDVYKSLKTRLKKSQYLHLLDV